jgi:5-methylcytosine-specific restriction endonuclease McrA
MRFPKPAKRSPKPRKRVKRSVRPHAVRQTKRAAQERKLDRLWADRILGGHPRTERCWIGCGRFATDAAHLISRRYKLTRWHPANGKPLCRECHAYYTARPEVWEIRVEQWLTADFYAYLWNTANRKGRVDLDQAARELAG